MLRKTLLLCCLALLLCAATALAEAPQDAALALHPGAQVTVLADGGDTVALALTEGEANILCMVEQIDDVWTVTIDNPTALRQRTTLPMASFDTDGSLLWRYDGYKAGDRDTYQALRRGPGQWGNVSLMCERSYDNGAGTTSIWWNEGKLYRAEKSDYRAERQYIPVPAAQMAEAVALANFDCENEAFPIHEEYDSWPGREAMAGAAAELFPGMTFRGGSLAGYGPARPYQTLEFLMQKPNGALVLECVIWDAVAGDYQVTESTPLPADSFYGVENFTNAVGIPGYGAVEVDYLGGGQWGITEFWPWNMNGDMFMAGSNWVGEGEYYGQRRIFGEGAHWQDITRTNWSLLPISLEIAAAQADVKSWAAVNNPNPADRLHLRVKPEKGAKSLGKYYNGTPVRVLQKKGDWTRVSIGGTEGWMMTQYLAFGLAAGNVPDAFQSRIAVKENVPVAVYREMDDRSAVVDESHTQFVVIGLIGEEWYHVWLTDVNEFGYIHQIDVWAGNG